MAAGEPAQRAPTMITSYGVGISLSCRDCIGHRAGIAPARQINLKDEHNGHHLCSSVK
jgi:hypothetical protein